MDLQVFDSREVWHGPLIQAAQSLGWNARRVFEQDPIQPGGFGFFRPHPANMEEHRLLDLEMRRHLVMVQDRAQVEVYEDKTEQWRRWGHLMPETWHYTSQAEAQQAQHDFPLVSKANEGASSVNVRILYTRQQYEAHVAQAFGPGIKVNLCAGGATTTQKGYLLVQRFIPHTITFRVNILGPRRAIFERFNYPDKPVAQTGNVRPVMHFTVLHESLIEYANQVAAEIGTRWCALDILRDNDHWTLLETSLAWPKNETDHRDTPLIGGGTWGQLWHLLCADLAAGYFGSTSPSTYSPAH
jgi:glutathione synthase/RimK-type ligase-like ATP-grasp enzyme